MLKELFRKLVLTPIKESKERRIQEKLVILEETKRIEALRQKGIFTQESDINMELINELINDNNRARLSFLSGYLMNRWIRADRNLICLNHNTKRELLIYALVHSLNGVYRRTSRCSFQLDPATNTEYGAYIYLPVDLYYGTYNGVHEFVLAADKTALGKKGHTFVDISKDMARIESYKKAKK